MRRVRLFRVLGLLLSLLFVLTACGNSGTIEVGATAPDFTLSDARGASVSLSDFSGQPTLLYFHMAVG